MKNYSHNFQLVWLRSILLINIFQIIWLDETFGMKEALIQSLIISFLFALLYGFIYPYLWNESIFRSWINILISSIANILCSYSILYVISPSMFQLLLAWGGVIMIITMLVHCIVFYVIAYYQNKQSSKDFNQLLKKHTR